MGPLRLARGNRQFIQFPFSLPDTYVIYEYAPACTGNTRADANALCGSAVGTCQPRAKGSVQYWRYEATVDRQTGRVLDPGWTQSPSTYCLGPRDVGVPPIAAIGGIVAGDFQDLIVLKGVAVSDPKGSTLVNYETGFHTDATTYRLDPITILGRTVRITATPERYDWYFGDGTRELDAGPGHEGTLDVQHTYRSAGRVAPYVVITWSGTYSVDGGAPRPVIGTATTTGNGTPLQVKQARAELVTR